MNDYCIYTYDNKNYITECGKIIPRYNYVGKYCTYCGKEIVVPIITSSYDDKYCVEEKEYAI